MKKSLLAAVLAIAASGIANATIKVDTPTITSIVGGSAWNYFVNGDGVETAVNTTTYFTIYDFAGYITGSAVAPSGWAVSVQNVGVTPTGVTVPDSTSIVNITWTFTGQNGTAIPVSQVGGFMANSTDPSVSTTLGYYTYQAFNPSPGVNTNDAGYGQVITPSAVPEPMSMALVGAGLALVGVARLRRRNA